MSDLTHLDGSGHVRMVDVGDKPATRREAVAVGSISMQPATLAHLREGSIGKGDVLAVARVAAIQAAKRTADWIPLCHPLALSGVEVELTPVEGAADGPPRVDVRVTVRCTGPTGVEMEALTAASAAALTIYDMCKAVDRGMVVGPFALERKSGGRSGTWERAAGDAGPGDADPGDAGPGDAGPGDAGAGAGGGAAPS